MRYTYGMLALVLLVLHLPLVLFIHQVSNLVILIMSDYDPNTSGDATSVYVSSYDACELPAYSRFIYYYILLDLKYYPVIMASLST